MKREQKIIKTLKDSKIFEINQPIADNETIMLDAINRALRKWGIKQKLSFDDGFALLTSLHEELVGLEPIADNATTEPVTNTNKLDAEEWLKNNCKPDDWDSLHECLKDGMWTNNVVKYMNDFAKTRNETVPNVGMSDDEIRNNALKWYKRGASDEANENYDAQNPEKRFAKWALQDRHSDSNSANNTEKE